ncbi:iron-containing alcohol dehydrogenase [Bordetella genomosp. 12]|uniref:Alcohol dehydrogenase n=1 Tax=Bordetella genomosp. 12 TaxID=463035 RepID=A0A261VD05_9BORD|nr:iron-containing alcohol dehydrogenase [Bordetella genomosp. 12]OZI71651.1 alcohol dehydrogenase [Bordetella genomosp. 12]
MSASSGSTSFTFKTVASVICGVGRSAELHDTLASMTPGRRAVIVTDAVIAASGMLRVPIDALRKAGWQVTTLDGVVADPPEEVVLALAAAAEQAGADVIIGWGGGSSMDSAKVLALLLGSKQALNQLYGIGKADGPRLPLLQVPTTAGTGSEVTPIAILSVGEGVKAGVVSDLLYADAVVLDPALTVGLPKAVTAATAIDAMVHAIEAYTTARLKNPISDHYALAALRMLISNIEAVLEDGENLQAREAMLLGSMFAGQAFANAPVGAVHALAYPIGGRFHIPHGLSNALMLPHVMRFNLPACASLYAELSHGLALPAAGQGDEAAAILIERMEQIIQIGDIPLRLRDVGIEERDLEGLAEDAMAQQRLLINNRRPVGMGDALSIYRQAF